MSRIEDGDEHHVAHANFFATTVKESVLAFLQVAHFSREGVQLNGHDLPQVNLQNIVKETYLNTLYQEELINLAQVLRLKDLLRDADRPIDKLKRQVKKRKIAELGSVLGQVVAQKQATERDKF